VPGTGHKPIFFDASSFVFFYQTLKLGGKIFGGYFYTQKNIGMKSSIRILLFCFIAFGFIGCDRISKDLAREHLMHRPPQSFFHDVFRLEYVENTGAFLSMGDDWPQPVSFWILSIFPLTCLLAVFVYALRKAGEMSNLMLFSVALIFSGGMGNVTDRILNDRHVTDFMNLGVLNLRTGIFNLADVYVSAGFILLLFLYRKS
jgi:signal peptidase II